MAKIKAVTVKTPDELSEALGLSRAEGAEIEFRADDVRF